MRTNEQVFIIKYLMFRSFRVDPKELEGRVIEHGQTVVQLGNHYFTLFALFICIQLFHI